MRSHLSESASERPAWERSRGESAKAYAAFRAFRDAGSGRSLIGARSIERRWSWKWKWSERAREWDDVQWRRQDEAVLAAVRPSPAVEVVPEPVVDVDPWQRIVGAFDDAALERLRL